jgi:hypothetical protein
VTVLLSEASEVSELRRLPSRDDGLEETRADGTLACALALKSTFSLTDTHNTSSRVTQQACECVIDRARSEGRRGATVSYAVR